MNDEFAKRVHSAAIAGWWTLLIAVIFVTVVWVAYMALMRAQPPCMLAMCGPEVTWSTIQTVSLWAVAVFKLFIWMFAMIVIWLTLWARRLRS